MPGQVIAAAGIQLAQLGGIGIAQGAGAQRVQVLGAVAVGQAQVQAILFIEELRRADIARLVEQRHQVGAAGQSAGMAVNDRDVARGAQPVERFRQEAEL